jgi:hypothetical protein
VRRRDFIKKSLGVGGDAATPAAAATAQVPQVLRPQPAGGDALEGWDNPDARALREDDRKRRPWIYPNDQR